MNGISGFMFQWNPKTLNQDILILQIRSKSCPTTEKCARLKKVTAVSFVHNVFLDLQALMLPSQRVVQVDCLKQLAISCN